MAYILYGNIRYAVIKKIAIQKLYSVFPINPVVVVTTSNLSSYLKYKNHCFSCNVIFTIRKYLQFNTKQIGLGFNFECSAYNI